jgi:dual specificity protein kinase YAK1
MFHTVMPHMYPPPSYELGQPLNLADGEDVPDDSTCTLDGHCIISVNEFIEDLEGHQFRVLDVLGCGTYSYVFKWHLLSAPGEFYAMKVEEFAAIQRDWDQ